VQEKMNNSATGTWHKRMALQSQMTAFPWPGVAFLLGEDFLD